MNNLKKLTLTLISCSLSFVVVGQDLCFKEVIIPEKFDTTYETVVIAEAYTELICVPPQFTTISKERTIREGYEKDGYRYIGGEKVKCKIDIPAVKQVIYEKKLISPAQTITKYHPAITDEIMIVTLKSNTRVIEVPIDCKTGDILRGY